MRLYYSFNQFLREKFGCKVWKLSLNAEFSCPNRDGTLSREGCVFCNNKAFSYFVKEPAPLKKQILHSMEYARRRFKAKKFIAYFQSFTNTYGEIEELKKRYEVIREFPEIVGLSISTRPDCVDKEKLKLIQSYTKNYMVWIEYGLGSIHNKSLALLNRNHTFEDFLKAVELTKNRDIFIGVHIILGIPTETRKDILNTAKVLSRLPLWGVKFHCLHVVKDTKLEKLYNQAQVGVLSWREYVGLLCDFLELIPSEWVILRLVSEACPDYLVAPQWLNQKQFILREIEKELIRRNSWQGKRLVLEKNEGSYSKGRRSSSLP